LCTFLTIGLEDSKMVIVMEMSTGKSAGQTSDGEVYGDEVLNAGWAEVPRIEARLEEVAVSARCEPARVDVDGFMARLYAFQE
jgi:hypothetical protein